MAFNEIFSSFIGNLFKKSEERIRFLSLTESLMKQLPSFFDDNVEKIDLQGNFSPLKPFINILELNKPSKEMIEKSAYSLHKRVFESYFKYGIADERQDMIIDEEIYYEKNRIRETVLTMLYHLFDKDVIVLNAQFLGQEAIEIIKILEKNEFFGRIIFCFDSIKIESSPKNVVDFFEEISNQNNFYDISNIKDEHDLAKNFSCQIENVPDFEILFKSLRNNRLFLALDQNLNLAQWVSENIERFGYTMFQKRMLNMELGISFYLSGKNDEASLFFNNVLESQHDDTTDILALIYLSKVMMRKKSNPTALKYVALAEQRLQDNKKSPFYAIAKMIGYLITERSAKDKSVEKYLEILALLKRHRLMNNYIKTILVVPWIALVSKEYRSLVMEKIDEAYELAEKIGNRFELSTACHWKGIILSYMGKPGEALDWYFKCNAIRSDIGNLLAMIKIRNGLSYEALISAEYDSAYDLINSFIGRLGEVDDYTEILNTLKNITFALFYVRHFDEAYMILQKIIRFIHLFNLEDTAYDSFVPEYNDMLIYKTFIELQRGEITRAKINLMNVVHNGRTVTPIEKPSVSFLEALLAAEERDFELSKKKFEEYKKSFLEVGETQEHRLVFMHYEYARTLESLGEAELSSLYFKEGLEFAIKKNLVFYTKFKTDLTLQEYLDDFVLLEPLNVNLGYLEEKAEKQKLMNQLQGTLYNYQFLNKIMGFASATTNIQTFVYNTVLAGFDYTMADAIFIYEKNESGWKNLSSSAQEVFSKTPDTDAWEHIIKERDPIKNAKLQFDSKLQAYAANLSKFGFTGVFIIYPSKQNPLSAEIINVLNIALSNIQSQLVMFKQNEHLVHISSTDPLSMLKNRHALQEFISLENERLRRYKTKRKFVVQETVAFIDLDNFKYYNDNFGHEAGDLFIGKFGQLLKSVYRRVDFIARFGGDEFVVILSDATCEEAKRVGERLFESLRDAKHFVPELEDFLGHKVSIPKRKLMNFSMGLCSNYDLKETSDLEQVLTNADHALYYSKKHGKGSITIWNEIKHSISLGKSRHKKTEF